MSDSADNATSSGLHVGLAASLLALGYFILSYWAIKQALPPANIAPIWFADGVAISFILSRPPKDWPFMFLATAVANISINLGMGNSYGLTSAYFATNILSILIGSSLLWRLRDKSGEMTAGSLVKLVALGGVAPAIFASSFGSMMLSLIGFQPSLSQWKGWLATELLGMVSVLPLGLYIVDHKARGLWQSIYRPATASALFLVTVGSWLATAYFHDPLIYMSLGLFIVALVGGVAGTITGACLTSVVFGLAIASRHFTGDDFFEGGQAHVHGLMIAILFPPIVLAASLETARRSAQRLAEQEKEYRLIYKTMPSILITLDGEGRMTHTNYAWDRFSGIGRNGSLGKELTEFLTTGSKERFQTAIWPRLQSGEGFHEEHLKLRLGEEFREVEISGTRNEEPSKGGYNYLLAMKDITRELELDAALNAERSFVAATLQSLGDGVVTTDPAGRVTYMNAAAESLTGWVTIEALGKPFSDVVDLVDEATGSSFEVSEQKFAGMSLAPSLPNELGIRTRNGGVISISAALTPIHRKNADPYGAVFVFQDVSVVRADMRVARYLAQHDALTGLPNRALLTDRLEQAILIAARNREQFALLFIDVDRFKQINDSAGHAAGDELLRALAARMKSTLRAEDTVARIGGDEFVIILRKAGEDGGAAEASRKLPDAMTRPIRLGDHDIKVSLSIGVSVFPKDGDDIATLMKNADEALYRAKRDGRGRVNVYDEEGPRAEAV